jgi:hypothetical protein
MRHPRGLRRLLARLPVVLLVSTALVTTSPAHACACGAMVDGPGGDTAVTAERAVVVWDGTQETILLRLSTRSEAVSAGLLVPTPASAKVELGDDQVFADLEAVTAPRPEERWRLFGRPLLLGDTDAVEDAEAGGGPKAGLDVLDSVDLGPLRATTLAAADPSALEGWLQDNGFATSPGLRQAVQPYVDEGWTFVAVQLDAVGQALQGDLPPIAMTFASDQAVYPMRMSAAAVESQHPTVYVLAQHRMERTDLVAQGSTRPDLSFAGNVSPGEVGSPALKGWLARTPYLTATSQWLPQPGQIVSDFTFVQAADDQPFQMVTYEDTYLLPGDVGALLLLLLVVAAVWGAVRLARRRSPALVEEVAPATVSKPTK